MSGSVFKKVIPLIAIGTMAAGSGGLGLVRGPAGTASGGILSRPTRGLGVLSGLISSGRRSSGQSAAVRLREAQERLRASEAGLETEARLEKTLSRQANTAGAVGANPNSGTVGNRARVMVAAADRRARRDRALSDSALEFIRLHRARAKEGRRRESLSRVLTLGLRALADDEAR